MVGLAWKESNSWDCGSEEPKETSINLHNPGGKFRSFHWSFNYLFSLYPKSERMKRWKNTFVLFSIA